MEQGKSLIYDLGLADLIEITSAWNQPEYRARQIWQGLYQQLWASPAEFTNLPKTLRERLAEQFSFSGLQPAAILDSTDHETRKTLFRLNAGNQISEKSLGIEAVLMKYERRRTLCVSTQAGCGMGCTFCATGQMGFKRNLSSGEIVEQVIYFARLLAAEGEHVSHVVVMGMGEPFHNYAGTMTAIDRLNDPDGFNLGARRFTISTVGLIPAIRQFAAEHRQVNLAISLHAANDELRSSMLPVNRKYPLADLLTACQEYVETTSRRLTFEWALIQGVNDTPEQAQELAQLLLKYRLVGLCHVNVIPLNPTQGFTGKATTHVRAEAFRAILDKNKIPCTIRVRRGLDIQAGCGQLATENLR